VFSFTSLAIEPLVGSRAGNKIAGADQQRLKTLRQGWILRWWLERPSPGRPSALHTRNPRQSGKAECHSENPKWMAKRRFIGLN